jgi:hypothetical protein
LKASGLSGLRVEVGGVVALGWVGEDAEFCLSGWALGVGAEVKGRKVRVTNERRYMGY